MRYRIWKEADMWWFESYEALESTDMTDRGSCFTWTEALEAIAEVSA